MDRDRIASALHCRAQDLMIDLPACDECGYQIQMINRRGCDYRQLCRDALALLKEQKEQIENLKQTAQSMMEGVCLMKEQEAVEPIKKEMVEITARYEFDCPCGAPLLIGQPYCADCGKSVKWNE